MTAHVLIITKDRALQTDLVLSLRSAMFRVSFWDFGLTYTQALPPPVFDICLFGPDINNPNIAQIFERLQAKTSIPTCFQIAQTPTAAYRCAKMHAGFADVFPSPLDIELFKAKVANHLRQKTKIDDLKTHGITTQSFGGDLSNKAKTAKCNVAVVSSKPERALRWKSLLRSKCPHNLNIVLPDHFLNRASVPPDLYILDGSTTGLQLLRHLSADPEKKHAATLMVTDPTDLRTAMQAVDLGVGDVVCDGFYPSEVSLRIDRLLSQKTVQDRLRASVTTGLRASIIDPLTELYNRRYAISYLIHMHTNAKQSGKKYALMMLDLDHFKRINDKFGHLAGDTVLIEFSRRIKANLRSSDMFARIGGEEFLIALPDTNPIAAQQAAERILLLATDQAFCLNDGQTQVPISISIGMTFNTHKQSAVAPYDCDQDNAAIDYSDGSMVNLLIERADRAMYTAKAAGRNTLHIDRSAA